MKFPLLKFTLAPALCLLAAALPAPAQRAATPAPAPYQFRNVTFIAGGFITGFLAHPSVPGLRYVRTDIGGAYRWDEPSHRWLPLQDWLPFSERNLLGVESFALDPTDPAKLYLAAGTYVNDGTPDGAILRSTDGGRHFSIIRLPFKLGGNEDGRFAGERLQVDPNHPQTLLLGTRTAGLYRSDDSGLHWARVGSFPAPPANKIGLTFVTFAAATGHPGTPTPRIFVGVDDPAQSLLVSDDAGRTWKPVEGAPHGLFPNHGALSSAGVLYLSYTDAPGPNDVGNGALWAFTLATGAWRDITPQRPGAGGPQLSAHGEGFGYGTVVVDPRHPQTLIASTLDRWHPGDTLFRTTDGGAHWQSLKEGATRDSSLAPYLSHIAPQPPFGHWIGAALIDPFDPAHVLYGTGETIWESHDVDGRDATHWVVGAPGLEETADIMLLSPLLPGPAGPHLYTGLGDIGCFRNDDFAHSPVGGAMKNPELSNCDAIALAAERPQEMVRVGRSWTPGAPHGALSHDGGLHWTPFATEPTGGERGGDAALSADGKTVLWSVPGQPLATSTDGGAHWTALPLRAAGRRPLQVLADARSASRFWIYDAAAGTLSTLDAQGAVASVSTSAPRGGRLRIAASRPGTLWISSRTGLSRSADDGRTWQPLANVAAAYAVGFGKAAPGAAAPAIYLAGALAGTPEAAAPGPGQSQGGGLYRSLDDGASWQRLDDPDHRYAWIEQVTGDPRVFGRIYFGTNGRGVFYGDPAPVTAAAAASTAATPGAGTVNR